MPWALISEDRSKLDLVQPPLSNGLRYVLVTPARNEDKFIRDTLASMVAQSRRPERWVIVSDGSTDRTDEIVAAYAQSHSWIQLIRMPERRDRNFAAKVQCFNVGLDALRDVQFDVIGNLDADVSFDPDYFEFLIAKFEADARLGVAGTPFVEEGRQYNYRFTNIDHVSGQCQLFRSACFREIGGYVPVRAGGIDWIAVTTARMKGWTTRTFAGKTYLHLRPMGTGSTNKFWAIFNHGRKDFHLGGHPVFQFCRALYQMSKPPYVIGGTCLLAGYVWAWTIRTKRPISHELMRFHRHEQMLRLSGVLRRKAEAVRK